MKQDFTLTNIHQGLAKRRWLIALAFGIIGATVWVVDGVAIITSLNPTLGHELALAEHPPLDVWISPPHTANATPTIISTPAGVRFTHNTITIPEGSILSAHLAEPDDAAPELVIDGNSTTFTTDSHGDFAVTMPLTSGKKLSIRRGWLTLASWRITVVPDNPPQVSITEPPTLDGKILHLSYSASDAFGINELALRVTPHEAAANTAPIDIALPITQAPKIAKADIGELTAYPWAGQKLMLQIVAINEAGKTSLSAPVYFVVPERDFAHPVSRILIEERKKLLQNPEDEQRREETANILAGIAHETTNFHSDPVVMMALRTSAVRLMLNTDKATATAVSTLLWQAAARIEDGSNGTAGHALSDTGQDSADMRGKIKENP